VSVLEHAGRINKEVQMRRFTNPRIAKPGPVRRPTRPADKLSRSRVGLGALLAVSSAVVLAGAGTAGAVGRYTDPSGDGKGSADVTGVSVASDANGQILITVSTAGNPDANGGSVVLFLDTDVNLATGKPGTLGADFLFGMDADSYGFARWTGSAWDWDTPYSTVRVATNASGAIVSVNRTELGATESFNFWVRTVTGEEASEQLDDAPDDGTFNYKLAAGGPDIREAGVKTSPESGPRAGRKFVVEPTTLLLPPTGAMISVSPVPESYQCAAKLGAKALRGTGAGGCTFAIPKKAKGKRLSVGLTVSYQGASKNVQLAYKVR
jgi:hypothetical protein